MHRLPFLKLLEGYPNDAIAERFVEFVGEHGDCFERSLKIGHITASAWVVSRDGSRALLTHHRKLGKWFQLGGHVDGNPDVLDAAAREVWEESGLKVEALSESIYDLDVHAIPARGDEPEHLHYDVRFLFRALNEDFTVSAESHALEWVPMDEMESRTDDAAVLRLRDKWLWRERA